MPRTALLHLLLLLGFTAPLGCAAQTHRATVLSLGDGDTIRVQQDGRKITVRLACIDAPEMAQQLRVPIGSEVRLDVKTTDRYGRGPKAPDTGRLFHGPLLHHDVTPGRRRC
jgi:endonuclease YncB( thermonuclease family)